MAFTVSERPISAFLQAALMVCGSNISSRTSTTTTITLSQDGAAGRSQKDSNTVVTISVKRKSRYSLLY